MQTKIQNKAEEIYAIYSELGNFNLGSLSDDVKLQRLALVVVLQEIKVKLLEVYRVLDEQDEQEEIYNVYLQFDDLNLESLSDDIMLQRLGLAMALQEVKIKLLKLLS